MDPTVNNTMVNGLTLFKTDSINTLVAILPLALAVLITISLISLGIRFFSRVSGVEGIADRAYHGKEPTDQEWDYIRRL